MSHLLLCTTALKSKFKIGIALIKYLFPSCKGMAEECLQTNCLNDRQGPVATNLKLSSKQGWLSKVRLMPFLDVPPLSQGIAK